MNKFLIVMTLMGSIAVTTANAQPVDYNVTNVYSYNRADYDSEGLNVRAFNVKPTLDVEVTNNDNIYATETGQTEDYIVVYNPKIEATTNWSRHDLTISAEGIFGEYASNNAESYQDYRVAVNSRIDVARETYFTAIALFNQNHEDRGSADDLNGVKPTEYAEKVLSLGFNKGLNKISLGLNAEMTELDYDDVFTSAGAELDNDVRDRNEYNFSARVGYEIIPEYEAFIRTTYRNIKYDNLGAVDRDNSGYEIVVGTDINVTSKVRGEVFAGYLHQSYDDATLSDINSPTFGASVLWQPSQLTSIDTAFTQSVQETSTSNSSSGYISTSVSVRLEHELRRNILLATSINYSNSSYEGAAAGQNERDDDVIIAGLDAKYLINKRFAIGAGYTFEERDSNIANQDYTRNSFMVNLSGSLY